MYTIRRGLAAKAGAIMAAGMYFGDDFLLASFFRPYTVRALTYLDCFRMDRSVLAQMFQYKQFPSFQVCIQWWKNNLCPPVVPLTTYNYPSYV